MAESTSEQETSKSRETKVPSSQAYELDSYKRENVLKVYHSRGGYAGVFSKKLKEFHELVNTGGDSEAIGHSIDIVFDSFNRFETAHHEFVALAPGIEDDRYINSLQHFEKVRAELNDAKEMYDYYVQKEPVDVHINPEDSASRANKTSKVSSTVSARAKAAAKRAMLESKAIFLKEQMAIEERKFKIEQELKLLQINSEIQAADVEEKVLSQYINETPYEEIQKPSAATFTANIQHTGIKTEHEMPSYPDLKSSSPHANKTTNKASVLNPYAPIWNGQPNTQIHHHKYSQNPLPGFSYNPLTAASISNPIPMEMQVQRQLLDIISLPKTCLMTFDGNPMDYWAFVNAFDSCVGQTSVSDGVKLNRLLQYCTGKAAQVVKPCVIMNAAEGYARARSLLKERFGNNYMIAEAWVKKLTEGPPIKANECNALRDLVDDVRACMEALKAMDMIEEIDSRCRMVRILERLPLFIQSRWRKEALQVLNRTGKYPNVTKFVSFLETLTKEIMDPVFGIKAVSNGEKDKRSYTRPHSHKGGVASFNVEVSEKSDNQQTFSNSVRFQTVKCFLCGDKHSMSSCKKFLGMTPSQRLEVVSEHKLCYNCIAFRNHRAVKCRISNICGVDNCKLRHSKLLHAALCRNKNSTNLKVVGEPTESEHQDVTSQNYSENKVQAHSSSACGKLSFETSKVSLPIVTVMVRGVGQNEFIRTNALLDPGSNKTFCSNELVKLLGLEGQRTTLNLKTLNDGKESIVEQTSLEVMSTIGKRKHRNLISLPKVYALEDFPVLMGSIASPEEVHSWDHMKDVVSPQVQNVSILIGQDVPQGLLPIEVRRGKDGEPYAIRTELGWTINGPLSEINVCEPSGSYFVFGKPNVSLESQVERFWTLDTGPVLAGSMPQMSVEDKKVLETWNDSIEHKEGHYELCIPFKTNSQDLPDNKSLALKRLQSLQKRFVKDPNLHRRYTEEVHKLLESGYAETIPDGDIECDVIGRTWYLPHHAVFNPNKPEKLRVVFDCAAEYRGTSLNKKVSQGPDIANKLLGVLLRFREGNIALMADIEAMFYQIKVPPKDRNALRFLWWKDGDVTQTPTSYRMTVHPFGGVWSPSCANFTLKRTATDNAELFLPETVDTVLRDFYVDDCLKSLDSEEKAVRLVKELRQITSMGGFRLTKWISNSCQVLDSIPLEERVKEVRDLELKCGSLPVERALGVSWNVQDDTFSIKVKERDTTFTKRSLLSITSSVYDPLGIVSPFVLVAKKIFQSECKLNKSWDDDMDPNNKQLWLKWLQELPTLQEIKIDRCILPVNFNHDMKLELHHFCDASQEAYGAVSYIRAVNTDGNTHCAFVIGKSRLAPIQQMSIPRLELSAAVLAVRLSSILKEELNLDIDRNVYWTDSMIVFQYIKNTTKRFHTFVANRIAIIHDGSTAESWRHVDTKSNPADDASRGLNVAQMVSQNRWLQGPEFLKKNEEEWPNLPNSQPDLLTDDKEVKVKAESCAVHALDRNESLDKLLAYYSSWHRLKRATAWMLKFKDWLRKRTVSKDLQTDDIIVAEQAIIHYIQTQNFGSEIESLKLHGKVSKKSKLHSLDPILDNNGLIRVGGRLLNAPISDVAKHPFILPKDHHVSKLIICHIHEFETKHSGREHVLSVVRQKYWIPSCRTLINGILRRCVLCKRLRSVLGSQKMSALPSDRVVAEHAPFTNVGVDCFGPFYVKRGRSQEKRYGCLFTCLSIRAVHIEKLHSLDADSFISALIRFMARRGIPKIIRSDNGTNFVGGEKELRQSIHSCCENERTKEYLLLRNIKWKFNPPTASHMGGVWERQIRSVRKVLNVLLKDQVLDDERLDTVFAEAENIVNGRPITYVSNNPEDAEPLTPNHLLLLRSNQLISLGKFKRQDCYQRRWRHAQYLADQFWTRWLAEYLPTLQSRKKWTAESDNFKTDDVVLVLDEATPRMNWPLGRVIETYPGKDGLVRAVKVKTKSSVFVRPIHKLCNLEIVTFN